LVVSEHDPSNDAVLIAKLRLGYKVLGLSFDAEDGPVLRLGYFHHPEHENVYRFRCGGATLNEHSLAAGYSGVDLLLDQIRRYELSRPPSKNADD
jgi:hypothetical protein